MKLRNTKYIKAWLAGTLSASIVLFVLLLPGNDHLHARGPMNTGHEDLKCVYCHISSDGSLRQQLQANVQYLLGNRSNQVDIGFKDVGNAACVVCHGRPRDSHPVYRFNEPKFSKVRNILHPHQCISCHKEHAGIRVTQKPVFCKNCHKKLKIKRDKISISHKTLVKQERWSACMGCHDFHGNHEMKIEEDIDNVLTTSQISEYFKGGPSPYSRTKKYKARKTP